MVIVGVKIPRLFSYCDEVGVRRSWFRTRSKHGTTVYSQPLISLSYDTNQVA
jgi:hypothetical protein